MIATDTMLARAGASATGRVYRVFVGPPLADISVALFVAGEPVTLPSTTHTVNSVTFGSQPIDIEMEDATGFSNAGGVFNLVGYGRLTYARYTGRTGNTLTGCTRVYGSYVHNGRTQVNQWTEITALLTTPPTGSEDADDEYTDWTWSIQGERFNSSLMRNDCSLLIMESVNPDDTHALWADFKIAALGFVRDWGSEGAANEKRKWQAQVVSLRSYVDARQIRGRTFGRVNLAAGQPVTASDALPNPIDPSIISEWLDGGGVIGNTGADKLTDGDINSGPYVSQLSPSRNPETPAATGASDDPGVIIEEVFLGDRNDPNLQWVKVRFAAWGLAYTDENGADGSQSLDDFAFTNKQTRFLRSLVDGWPPEIRRPRNSEAPAFYYFTGEGITLTPGNDTVVFTNNKARFLARWAVTDRVQVVDWRHQPAVGGGELPGVDFTLDENDWLQFRYIGLGIPQTVRDMVVWGTHTGTPWWNNAADEDESGTEWDEDPAESPDIGESIRRFPVAQDSNKNDEWIRETRPDPIDRRTDTDVVFVAVPFEDIPTALSEDITATEPSDNPSDPLADRVLPLSEPDYLMYDPRYPTTPLTIKIDAEEMVLKYSGGVWHVMERGANGTTPATHDADTPVFYYYEDVGFIRHPYVSGVELHRWERWDVVLNDAPIPVEIPIERVPKIWELWGSREDSPLFVGEDADYELDWVGRTHLSVTNRTTTPFIQKADLNIPIPLKWGMVEFKSMNIDNTHILLNEILFWRAGMGNAAPLAPGIGGTVMYYLDQFPGLEYVAYEDVSVFSNTSGDITTTDGGLGQTLYDLAASHMFHIEYTRDCRIRIKRPPMFPLESRPEITAVIGPAMIRGTLDPQWSERRSRATAGQYVVNVRDVNDLTVYQGKYPPVNLFGDVIEREFTAATSSIDTANYIAQMLYLSDEETNNVITFTTVGPFPELAAGQRILVYDFTDDAAIKYVDCFIRSVEHNYKGAERVTCQVWRQV